jgi:GDP-L-fucose synthase
MNLNGASILVTGASGFVGRNLVELLCARGLRPITPTRAECDLLEQDQIRRLLADTKPDIVFHAAGVVGGNLANRERPAEFHYNNLMMGAMLLHESWRGGVKKYVGLMGGCSYPAQAPNPIKETSLFHGPLHPDSAPYSHAKSMAFVQAEAYRRQYSFDAIILVPGNLYGPYDNFELSGSHVIPALIRKYLAAKEENKPSVEAWGSGKPVRDFVYVTDACAAILLAAEKYSSPNLINISSGVPVTIKELTETIAELTGYTGQVNWDATKPDGQMFKGYDVTRMKEVLGFQCHTSLRDGLKRTIDWYLANRKSGNVRS